MTPTNQTFIPFTPEEGASVRAFNAACDSYANGAAHAMTEAKRIFVEQLALRKSEEMQRQQLAVLATQPTGPQKANGKEVTI